METILKVCYTINAIITYCNQDQFKNKIIMIFVQQVNITKRLEDQKIQLLGGKTQQ